MPQFIMQLMSRLMFSCKEITESVSLSLDRDLPVPQRLRMRMHFLMCVLCSRYRDQLRFIRRTLRNNVERLENQATPLPAGLSHQARERIRDALARF